MQSVNRKYKIAHDFETLEDEWRIYLNAIEKSWVKVARVCSHVSTKFQPSQGFYTKQRKKDPLLKYLKHARNSDQHSISKKWTFIAIFILIKAEIDEVYVGT